MDSNFDSNFVEIIWKDITLFKGVFDKNEIDDLETQKIRSVGYLVKETKEDLIIALSLEITEPNRFIDLLKIPKANIIKKTFLYK